MPGEDIQSWSVVAANNANSDTSINWAEGQPRASVNNSARSQMAAHAKDRNLKNGSITTGGSANAQTFTSGVSYTVVPTNLVVRLKLGFSSTGGATLEMDGLGAVTIKDQAGHDLIGGELVAGTYVEFLYNGTNWILLGSTGGGIAPSSGRLTYVSGTQLKFAPFNGDRIKVSGILYQIPAAGIAGLANTSVFVNGVAAQNLVSGTLYYVYAFVNAGVVTGDFSTTGHATSSTVGNEGVEIKSGDDTRTLIGLVAVGAGNLFYDDSSNRLVASWFNRAARSIFTFFGNVSTAGLVAMGAPLPAVCWPDETVYASFHGEASTDGPPFSRIFVRLDGSAFGTASAFVYGPSALPVPISASFGGVVAEGRHSFDCILDVVNTGTGTVYLFNSKFYVTIG